MPHAFRVFLDLTGEGSPSPAHLRGFASSHLDEDHRSQVKPFTVGRCVPVARPVWSLDIATATDATAAMLVDRLTDGTPMHFGDRLSGRVVGSPVVMLERSWADLADSPPITGLQLSFDTPLVFLAKDKTSLKPTGGLIFGHLRRRWRYLDPSTAQDVSFDGIEFGVHLDGTAIPVKGASTQEGKTDAFRGRLAKGFVGVVTLDIRGATVAERYALGALAGAAPFLGCGAWTNQGFGATSLLAFWVDD